MIYDNYCYYLQISTVLLEAYVNMVYSVNGLFFYN